MWYEYHLYGRRYHVSFFFYNFYGAETTLLAPHILLVPLHYHQSFLYELQVFSQLVLHLEVASAMRPPLVYI